MSENILKNRTGKPSVDRPWIKYYPESIRNMQIPKCTVMEYLKSNYPGESVTAMHYYGTDISWKSVFENTEAVARSLRALGFGENDQIPVYLSSVPEFVYLFLAAEKIGASLLCRDNTIEENVEAARKAKAKAIIAHDYLSQEELEQYLANSDVEKVVLLDTCYSCDRMEMPEHIQRSLGSRYPEKCAHGPATMSWDDFLGLGKDYSGNVEAYADIDRPLLCAYTSGSTGPSKQVIHSANTIISVIHQMNFYAGSGQFRPTWMLAVLPPALIAVVVSGILMPLASNKLLILDPFCDPNDIDLEVMRYRPNSWMMIPMFFEVIMCSKRIPKDYDMSYLLAAGVGCEAYNNTQIKRAQRYLEAHNCHIRFTTGYGSSEAGSNSTLPMSPHVMGDGNVGVPLPLNNMSVFKPDTQEELTYNQIGEICITGPGMMLGYDNKDATRRAMQMHEDGSIWLHTGDIGFMNEDGVVHVLTRGKAPRYGGGDLATLPMENLVGAANIEGIEDQFFVVIPDDKHDGYFLPYLYVILKDGYKIEDIKEDIYDCLEPHMYPVQIYELPERPFFHFKTNRIGLTQAILTQRKTEKMKKRAARA